jgi:starch-binding outer membrane protein, SusD/RagB family
VLDNVLVAADLSADEYKSLIVNELSSVFKVPLHFFKQIKIKEMKKIAIITIAFLGLFAACDKSELDVKNPNQPTPESATTESGIISLAQGSIYLNGFRSIDPKFNDGVYGRFWSGAVGFHEMLGDNIGIEAANAFLNQFACPDAVTLDDGKVVLNPNSPKTQYELLRAVNKNANSNSNPIIQEWAYMYSLNNGSNNILKLIENITFTGNAEVKKNTLKAWAYWWKGFAYSRIGSIYYAGIINDEPNVTNPTYVTKEKIIEEATANFDKAATVLTALGAGGGDYDAVLKKLIPDFCQKGKGGILTPAMWLRNINTMKARNILANTPVASMTAAQWNAIATFTANGVKETDLTFTGRSNEAGDIWVASNGTVAAKATSNAPGGNTYKISERLVQDFKTGDKRFDNNFVKGTQWIGNADRGNAFNTRYTLKDGGAGMAGTIVYSNRTANADEIYLVGTFEENTLMQAEAKIYTGDIGGALPLIDAVRKFQGAGLTDLAGTTVTLVDAKEELRRERRSALAFRGLAFYDARRWGITEKGSQGRTGAVVVDGGGKLNTNATIKYNYLDYWDVPDNELAYNAADSKSAPIANPKK